MLDTTGTIRQARGLDSSFVLSQLLPGWLLPVALGRRNDNVCRNNKTCSHRSDDNVGDALHVKVGCTKVQAFRQQYSHLCWLSRFVTWAFFSQQDTYAVVNLALEALTLMGF